MEKSSSLRPLRLGEQTKNFVFLGEAGSGKSEIAINFALSLHQQGGKEVHLFDLDMTPCSAAGIREKRLRRWASVFTVSSSLWTPPQ